MQALISNNNGGFTDIPLFQSVDSKSFSFIFNIVNDKKLSKRFRFSIVQSLIRLDGDLELQLQSRIKWEKLIIDTDEVKEISYSDIPSVVACLKYWISNTELNLSDNITIKLTQYEALMYVREVFENLYDINIDDYVLVDREMVIIRNEYATSEPFKYPEPLDPNLAKFFVTGYDKLVEKGISVGCENKEKAYKLFTEMSYFPQFRNLCYTKA